jgi:hypothetical protein
VEITKRMQRENSAPRAKFRLMENGLFKETGHFPLGGILRAERNFSLSCDFSGGDKKRQRKMEFCARCGIFLCLVISRVEIKKFCSARKISPSGKWPACFLKKVGFY